MGPLPVGSYDMPSNAVVDDAFDCPADRRLLSRIEWVTVHCECNGTSYDDVVTVAAA